MSRVNVYARRIKVADIHSGADVHETAEIGNMPESRELLAARAKRADQLVYDSYTPWFPAVIGSTGRVGPFATVDGGLKHNTVVNGWVFAHAHVGHDARIEEGAEVSTGAVIGGHARVGKDARVGLGAVVLPFKVIGDGARVGAGAVVTKDVPAGEVWAGVPARPLNDRPTHLHTDPRVDQEWVDWYVSWAVKPRESR